MKLAITTKYAAIGAVAGIAAYASYTHMRDLALEHGQYPTVAALLPVSVDGMLIVSTIVMREDRQAGLKVRPWAWIAFVLGVLASLAANVLAAQDDITSRVISAWPAVALFLVVEVLTSGRKLVEGPAEVKLPAAGKLPAEVAPNASVGGGELPAEVEAPRPARKPAVKAAAKPTKTTPRRPAEVTRKLAEEALTSSSSGTRKAVAEQLDITPRQLRRVLNGDTGEQPTVNGTPVLAEQPS